MSRPEGTQAPAAYYDDKEAVKYNSSSRIINIQAEITQRAIELLVLPTHRPSYILDIGCGSGLSGQELENAGHYWAGCDISRDMLNVAAERESEAGDLVHQDIGLGAPDISSHATTILPNPSSVS
jgi:18S rRNA (guanine1575-N7)-methyltransferase